MSICPRTAWRRPGCGGWWGFRPANVAYYVKAVRRARAVLFKTLEVCIEGAMAGAVAQNDELPTLNPGHPDSETICLFIDAAHNTRKQCHCTIEALPNRGVLDKEFEIVVGKVAQHMWRGAIDHDFKCEFRGVLNGSYNLVFRSRPRNGQTAGDLVIRLDHGNDQNGSHITINNDGRSARIPDTIAPLTPLRKTRKRLPTATGGRIRFIGAP